MSKLLDTFDAWYLAEYGVPVSRPPRETLAAAQMRAAFNAGYLSATPRTTVVVSSGYFATNSAGGASELSGEAQAECMRRDALGLPFDLAACNEVARRKRATIPFNPLDHEQTK